MNHPRATTTGELRRLRRLAYAGFTASQAGREMRRDTGWAIRWAQREGFTFNVHHKQSDPHPAPDILLVGRLCRMMARLAELGR